MARLSLTKISALALGALVLFGLVLSFLPTQKHVPLSEIELQGVDLSLHPAADAKAKWVFKAGKVKYNPDTRESVATELGAGQRIVDGKVNLFLKAKEITIDSADNLRTQTAKIFKPNDPGRNNCYYLNLGKATGTPVFIDQNSGYSAPYVDTKSPSLNFVGEEFKSNFALSKTEVNITKGQSGKKYNCAGLLQQFQGEQ